jgi:hypothetical protein
MDGANLRRVQGKLVGYSEDRTNVNRGAPYDTLQLVDASLSLFGAFVFECSHFSSINCLLCVVCNVKPICLSFVMCNVFGDHVFDNCCV